MLFLCSLHCKEHKKSISVPGTKEHKQEQNFCVSGSKQHIRPPAGWGGEIRPPAAWWGEVGPGEAGCGYANITPRRP